MDKWFGWDLSCPAVYCCSAMQRMSENVSQGKVLLRAAAQAENSYPWM